MPPKDTHEPYCELVLEHHNTIGQLTKGMETVEKQTSRLFTLVGSIEQSSNENRGNLEKIKDKLDNGITDALETIKRKLENPVKEENGTIKELKENSWVVKILALSVKKALVIVFCGLIFFAFALALMNTAFWAQTKEKRFLEKPGQQEHIYINQLNGYRTYEKPDGKVVFYANDTTKPAWVYDPKTGLMEKCPQWRTDEGLGIKGK